MRYSSLWLIFLCILFLSFIWSTWHTASEFLPLFKTEWWSIVHITECWSLRLSRASVDRHWGCSLLLAVLYNAAVKMGVPTFFFCINIQKQNCWIIWWFLCLISWGTTVLFSVTFAPFYLPANLTQAFCFLHVLVSTCYFLVFRWHHPSGCEAPSRALRASR